MEKTKVLKDCSLDGLTNGEINIIYESCNKDQVPCLPLYYLGRSLAFE